MQKTSSIKKTSIRITLWLTLSTVCLSVLLYVFQFNDPVSDEDIYYADKILKEFNVSASGIHDSYSNEVLFIQHVQHAVLSYAFEIKPIPMYHTRNLKDIYELKKGLCYDKSHAIEKILKVYGFKTRHISIYYYNSWFEKYWICFVPHSNSHAVSEVKTKHGWMLVDSIHDFRGVSKENEPLCLNAIRKKTFDNTLDENSDLPDAYQSTYIFFYGFYSRNGKLYPPYTMIPDYKFEELVYNFQCQ